LKLFTDSENHCVRLCKRGNVKAQYKLYRQYSRAMFNIAIRMTGDRQMAEDILQDAFAKAFSELYKLNDEKAFGGWLKRIVINRCIDVMRKEKNDWFSLENISERHLEIQEEIEEATNPEIVHHFIKKLPEGARQILVLHALEGMKHAEISSQLGVSESTVKTQFFRAKKLLAKLIEEANYEIRDRKIPEEKPVEA